MPDRIEFAYEETPNHWEAVPSEAWFLNRTEWAGFFAKGTALAELRKGVVRTPYYLFRITRDPARREHPPMQTQAPGRRSGFEGDGEK